MGLSSVRSPQGKKLRLWLFFLLINDLDLNDNINAHLWKYVDDTTTSEIVPKGHQSCLQSIANRVIQWSSINLLKLTYHKCKE